MEHDETGCQPHPEIPILCINNCGFFGSSSNMNMCSKCYKDSVLKQEQASFAASSIDNIVNGSSSSSEKKKELSPTITAKVESDLVETKAICLPSVTTTTTTTLSSAEAASEEEPKQKEGPSRCNTCKKRVGLTGFKCRCGHMYCGSHRYSDKHDCQFDYRTAGKDAIAKANPVVKADKLDRI